VALLITVVGVALFAVLILSSMRSFLRAFSWFSAPPGTLGGSSPGSGSGEGCWIDGLDLLGCGIQAQRFSGSEVVRPSTQSRMGFLPASSRPACSVMLTVAAPVQHRQGEAGSQLLHQLRGRVRVLVPELVPPLRCCFRFPRYSESQVEIPAIVD
jgi:hypothetical protein